MRPDQALHDRIRPLLRPFARRRQAELTEMAMFGGYGFLLNGNMCVGTWKGSLIVRMNKDDDEAYWAALDEEHVLPFDITGRPMRGWLMVQPAGIEEDDKLKRWIKVAAQYAGSLPAK